jgi:aryl-alcohol dehydrogenase-like predicted oxidoreductase
VQTRMLGKTGLEASQLGMGLFQIGELTGADAQRRVDTLLNTALDNGINFLDTAACYSASEDYIGNAVSSRRNEYILATKTGHPTNDLEGEHWSADLVEHSVERSLRRLKVDELDILQIHSCGMEFLEKGDVIEALIKAKQAGKTKFIGYSGDNEAAQWAVDSGIFDTLQTSFNMVDQRARYKLLASAKKQDMGVIIKRPVGNTVWGEMRTTGPGNYVERANAMAQGGLVDGAPDDAVELALGFLFAHEEIDTAIVGTTNVHHLLSNKSIIEDKRDLPTDVIDEIHRRFDELDNDWYQQM